jgi:hypothetical protein
VVDLKCNRLLQESLPLAVEGQPDKSSARQTQVPNPEADIDR